MDEPASQPTGAPLPYEAPAILWEDELTALAACSPACHLPDVCYGDICIPGGG